MICLYRNADDHMVVFHRGHMEDVVFSLSHAYCNDLIGNQLRGFPDGVDMSRKTVLLLCGQAYGNVLNTPTIGLFTSEIDKTMAERFLISVKIYVAHINPIVLQSFNNHIIRFFSQ